MPFNFRPGTLRRTRKLNPLKHVRTMLRLNPYITVQKRVASKDNKLRSLARETYLAKKEGVSQYNAISIYV